MENSKNNNNKKAKEEIKGATAQRERRAIPSHAFSKVVKMFSHFPDDHNPFSHFASFAILPEYLRSCSENPNNLRGQKSDSHDGVVASSDVEDASNESVGSVSGVDNKKSIQDKVSSKSFVPELCEGIRFSVSKPLVDELNWINEDIAMAKKLSSENTNTGISEADTLMIDELDMTNDAIEEKPMDKKTPDEDGTTIRVSEVDQANELLSDLERILMNKSDDFCGLQLPNKDVNSGFLNDFSSILDSDVFGNNSLTIERKGERLTVDDIVKGDVANEKKFRDEENMSSSKGEEARTENHISNVKEKSGRLEVLNQCFGTCAKENQRKFCKEKIPQGSSKYGGLISAAETNRKGGLVLITSGKGNKSGIATKGKTKKATNAFVRDVNSEKNKLSLVDRGTSDSMKSGGGVSDLCGSIAKKKAHGDTGIVSARKGGSNSKSCKRTHYSRKELQKMRKMTSIPVDVLKAVQEIDAVLYGKVQNSAAGKMIGERRGSLEAKKEKKKQRKRKKRAEMNEKLGVKRLKLEPVPIPKVTQVCHHYLNGRCQEGKKCKFSHDVIPLTKSKPCSHFAHQSCLKGDDCPYDHQLSNYPCNSYVASGFCSKGDSCFFSHKVTHKEGSETMESLSKSIELANSNTEQLVNSNASFSSDITTPKSLQEDKAKQNRQLLKAPKGISFISPEKLPMKNFGKHKEADLYQKSDRPGTLGPLHKATTTTAVSLIKTLMDNSSSGASRAFEFIKASARTPTVEHGKVFPSDRSDNSAGFSDQPKTGVMKDNRASVKLMQVNARSSFASLKEPVGHEKVYPPSRSDSAGCTGDQLKIGMSEGSVSLEQISAPSSGELPCDNGGVKLQARSPSTGLVDPKKSDKESAYSSENITQQKLRDSLASSDLFSIKGGLKSTRITAQRALQSTLAFAAKFESGIRMTSATPKITKNEPC